MLRNRDRSRGGIGVIGAIISFFTWNDVTDAWDGLGVLTWDDMGP